MHQCTNYLAERRARNGIFRRGDRRLNTVSWADRNRETASRKQKSPPMVGRRRKSPQSSGWPDWVVADAVQVEPVSHLEFPANREINREFRQNRRLDAILHADTPANSEACSEIPYSTKQGIFAKEQGILDCTRRGEQGFCLLKTEIVAGRSFRYPQCVRSKHSRRVSDCEH